MRWLLFSLLTLPVCVQSFILASRVKRASQASDELHYEYFSHRLPWKAADELCKQQSKTLATVSTEAENQQISRVLKYWNISHPVWIGRKIPKHQSNSYKTFILDFSRRSDQTHALLLHKFPSMSSVTVCTHLRFNTNSFGISTIFSYSANEFQLRANLAQGKPVMLALLVHGKQGPYVNAFQHDDSWHSVCVSWSQNGGSWALYTHGHMVSSGNGVNSNDNSISPNGSFIIGQGQNDAFSGSITELHIWDRVLSSCEILGMENECSTISSGLVLQWSEVSLEIEASLKKLLGKSPCQEKFTDITVDLFNSLLHGTSWQNQTFTVEVFHRKLVHEDCRVFDPVTENCHLEDCNSLIEVVCQFKQEKSSLPNSPFVRRLSEDPTIRQVMEVLSLNSSGNRDLPSLQQLTQAALRTIEADGPHLLTSSDVLYLSRLIDGIAARSSGTNSAEVMVSIATNYLNLASVMLEPHMSTQWVGRTEDGANIGPFTVIKSIDSLTEALADTLSAGKKGFTLSTKNIGDR